MKEKFMIKAGRIFLLFFLMAGLLTACADSKEEVKDKEEKTPTETSKDNMIPEEEEAAWQYFHTTDWYDIGQVVEEEWVVSEDMEEPEQREVVIYETTADITHDGIDDLLRVSAYVKKDQDISGEKDAVEHASYGCNVKLYRGLQDGSFETSPRFISEDIDNSHAVNGTICLCYKEGQDYLLIGDIYEIQGIADYDFTAFYVDDREGIVIDNQDQVDFSVREEMFPERWDNYEHRSDVVPGFKEKITPYIEDAIILISLNVDTGTFYSTSEKECVASELFDKVWARDY